MTKQNISQTSNALTANLRLPINTEGATRAKLRAARVSLAAQT